MKKIAALVLALVLALTCISALADATYSVYYTTEDLAGITDFNGFVTGCALNEMNYLVLKDDGTYEYTKVVGSIDAEGNFFEGPAGHVEIRFVFTGTYTREGSQVTLNSPEECVFDEDWGALVAAGYMQNSKGTASAGDLVVSYSEEDKKAPMDCFSAPVYKFDGYETPVSITLNEDGTFTYNTVASSDDD